MLKKTRLVINRTILNCIMKGLEMFLRFDIPNFSVMHFGLEKHIRKFRPARPDVVAKSIRQLQYENTGFCAIISIHSFTFTVVIQIFI